MNATTPDILFYLFSAVMLFSAVRAVTVPHIFRAALYLALVLGLLGAQYLLLNAEFVAMVQILVYVGAVVILIIFAVMLTAQMGDENVEQNNKFKLPAFIGSAVFFGVLVPVLLSQDWSVVEKARVDPNVHLDALGNIQGIGHALLTSFVFPFEMVALVLLTALVGAVVIARKDPDA